MFTAMTFLDVAVAPMIAIPILMIAGVTAVTVGMVILAVYLIKKFTNKN